MKFEDLGLNESLLKAIQEKGYDKPSLIQEKAIPVILKGKDILASAQTGTGKTAGFVLPILQQLSEKDRQGKRKIKTLILTPTRELAAQILDNTLEYSKHLNVKTCVIFGGVKQNPQIRRIRDGVDILIATPGRLLDLHDQGIFSLKQVETFVLDEADRMLDMGFQRDLNRIMNLLPERRQNLLFSATFSKEIKRLANSFLHEPATVEAAPENSTAEKIDQKIYRVDKGSKTALTIHLIKEENWEQALIFTRTKHGANRLTQKLVKKKISAAAIHGDKSQGNRTKTLKGFKDGTIKILVATDIAARGLDIPLLPHVMNYDLPNVPEDYVHRIGRTGRAGASGLAVSLVDVDELQELNAIQKLLNLSFAFNVVEGFEPTNSPSKPIQKKKYKPTFSKGSKSVYKGGSKSKGRRRR